LDPILFLPSFRSRLLVLPESEHFLQPKINNYSRLEPSSIPFRKEFVSRRFPLAQKTLCSPLLFLPRHPEGLKGVFGHGFLANLLDPRISPFHSSSYGVRTLSVFILSFPSRIMRTLFYLPIILTTPLDPLLERPEPPNLSRNEMYCSPHLKTHRTFLDSLMSSYSVL